jgi:hypothetical protein
MSKSGMGPAACAATVFAMMACIVFAITTLLGRG